MTALKDIYVCERCGGYRGSGHYCQTCSEALAVAENRVPEAIMSLLDLQKRLAEAGEA